MRHASVKPPRRRCTLRSFRLGRRVLGLLGLLLMAALPAAAQSGGTMRGRVLAKETGSPVAGAAVSLGDASPAVRTDSLGQFQILNVPAGPHVLSAQAVGYAIFKQSIVMRAGEAANVEIMLSALSTTLDTVRTKASSIVVRDINLAGFEERRAMGLGRFLTAAEIDARPGSSLAGILRTKVAGLNVVRYGSNSVLASSRGPISKSLMPSGDDFDRAQSAPPRCYVQIIVDNLSRYGSGVREPLYNLDNIDPTSVAAADPPPPQSIGSAACGAR